MKSKILFYLLFNSTFLFSQEELNAKITIDENLNLKVNQIFKDSSKDIYLFAKDISLNANDVLFLKESGKYKECEIQNVNNISFEVITNTSKLNNDFFITDLKYLGIKKITSTKLKKFNLDFSSSKYKIIFPQPEDLNEKYTTSPKIVAGNFNSFEQNGFKVYYLEIEKVFLDEMKKANIGMNNSFNYYSKYFGEKRKPKIVFAPIDGPSKTNENIIVYDSNVIKGKNRENSISHEIAHIWFGQDGIVIKERPLTEGIAEFLSMQYIISQYGEYALDEPINKRLFDLEGQNSLENLKNNNLDKKSNHFLSYKLIPIYLYSRQLNNINFINELANLYKNKEKDRKTNLVEINKFFESKGIESISTDELFPDFFISDYSPTEICITSNSEKNYNVEIEVMNADNQKSIKTLFFSKEQKQQKIKTENVNRVIIDPLYKILQNSRLNDVWTKNDNNIFDRNRYFKISKKIEIAFISSEIADFLSGKTNNISDKIGIDAQQKRILEELKTNFLKNVLTGGVCSFAEKSNSLFLYFALNERNTNKTTILKTIFKIDSERSAILDLKVEK